jgi:hypothetical protein
MNFSRKTLLGISVMFTLATSAYAADDHKGHNHDGGKDAAHAHDVKPMYGGVVTEVKDINYELVAKPDGIALYVTDHGKPVDVKGGAATVTLLSASDKTEAKLSPAEENKLEAKGAFKVTAGVKAIASVTLPGQSTQSVRFTIR